ncbi:MAG: SagB/ThcOx family dehydrogenase [Candidatus Thorarchaeota archaeon]|nr:SagB/ThcOx family dehydrogenase [Candidatus Thorarchaeota archaeon]
MTKASKNWKATGALITIAIAVFLAPIVLYQNWPSTDLVMLPNPDTEGHLSLTNALHYSTISEDLDNCKINMTQLSQLLWSMQGITNDLGLRAAPSAGGTYPLEIFVHVQDSEGVPLGLHKYMPPNHHLLSLSSNSTIGIADAFDGSERAAIENVSLVLFVIANYSRTTSRYGERGIQYVHLEVGHVLQNCLLELASLSLATRPITVFDSGRIQFLLRTSLMPLLVLPIGIHGDGVTPDMQHDSSDLTVEQAILQRRSRREYQEGEIPGEFLNQILGNLSALESLSSKSLIDMKIVIGNLTGLSSGLYDYSLSDETLSLVELGDIRDNLAIAGLDQPWIRDAQTSLVLSFNYSWVELQMSADIEWRRLLFSMGMLAQVVYLECTALSLGTVSIGAFYEYQVIDLVQAPSGFLPVYIMPIGLL